MSTRRYAIRTRRSPSEGRRILGVTIGGRGDASDVVTLLTEGADEPPADTEPVLTVTPHLRQRARSGTHELGGALGGGATLVREGYQKLTVREPGGEVLATVRIKTLPHRLRVEHRGGGRIQLRNRAATHNPIRAVKRSVTGGLLATWDGEQGLRIELHAAGGYAEVDEAAWPTELRLALIAAVVGVEFSIDPSDVGD